MLQRLRQEGGGLKRLIDLHWKLGGRKKGSVEQWRQHEVQKSLVFGLKVKWKEMKAIPRGESENIHIHPFF